MSKKDEPAPKSEQQKIADMAIEKAEAAKGILVPTDVKVGDVCKEPDPTGKEGTDKMRDIIEKTENEGNGSDSTGTW